MLILLQFIDSVFFSSFIFYSFRFNSIIPRYGETLIIVLIIISALLLCYLIYLYIKIKFFKFDKHKDILENQNDEEKQVTRAVENSIKNKTILNYSIQASLHLATDETMATYETLMNHMLQYQDVKQNQTWKYIRFIYKNKSIAKVKMQGKTIKLFLAISVDEANNEKYHLEDVSQIKTHEKTPSLLTVKGPRSVQYALELIRLIMNKYHAQIQDDYTPIHLNIKSMSKLQLLKKGLIKTNDATFIESLEEEEKKNKQ